MIEINLLPLHELHRRKRRLRALLVTGLALALLGTLLGYHHMIQSRHIARLENELSVAKRDRPGLLSAAEKVEGLRKKIMERHRKIQALARVGRGRTILSGLLGSLPETLPAELWLTSLKASNENFNLEGMAPDHRTIADFLGNLSMVSNLHHLDLIEVSTKENSGTGHKRFEIQGRLTQGLFSGEGHASLP